MNAATRIKPLTLLVQQSQGAAAVEFALVAPLFLLFVMGSLNLGQMAWGKAMLNGAVQQAARNSTIEMADIPALDERVRDTVVPVLPGVEVSSTRRAYFDFSDVGRAEPWNDLNANGTCDNDEAYTDENRNGIWDSDVGLNGNGNASDTVVYTVTAKYKPLFPIPFAPKSFNAASLTSSAVRKNQPFAAQAGYGKAAGNCS